jgi:cation/acetate symporter
MAVGTSATILLIALSPTIQVEMLGQEAWFPLRNPALLTIPLAFATGIAVSLRTRDHAARSRFEASLRQVHLGHRDETVSPS